MVRALNAMWAFDPGAARGIGHMKQLTERLPHRYTVTWAVSYLVITKRAHHHRVHISTAVRAVLLHATLQCMLARYLFQWRGDIFCLKAECGSLSVCDFCMFRCSAKHEPTHVSTLSDVPCLMS